MISFASGLISCLPTIGSRGLWTIYVTSVVPLHIKLTELLIFNAPLYCFCGRLSSVSVDDERNKLKYYYYNL